MPQEDDKFYKAFFYLKKNWGMFTELIFKITVKNEWVEI